MVAGFRGEEMGVVMSSEELNDEIEAAVNIDGSGGPVSARYGSGEGGGKDGGR